MASVINLKEVIPLFPESGGIIFQMQGVKPADFVDNKIHAKIYITGDDFWSALKDVFGRTVVNTAKMTMHPFTMNSDCMDFSQLRAGTEFAMNLNLGLAQGNNPAKFKQRTVHKKMQKMIERGDPMMIFTVKSKNGRMGVEKVLFEFRTKCSQIMAAEAAKSSLLLPLRSSVRKSIGSPLRNGSLRASPRTGLSSPRTGVSSPRTGVSSPRIGSISSQTSTRIQSASAVQQGTSVTQVSIQQSAVYSQTQPNFARPTAASTMRGMSSVASRPVSKPANPVRQAEATIRTVQQSKIPPPQEGEKRGLFGRFRSITA